MPSNRLPAAERAFVAGSVSDPDCYGVLRPAAGAHLPVLAVDRETALLFLTLRTPGPLPDYVAAVFGAAADRDLSRLLLDRVLEVGAEHGFVSGTEACALLGLDTPLGEGRLARLAHEALRYGQALELDDPGTLARKLYRYNRQPATPTWRRRLSDRAAVGRFLGIDAGSPGAKTLDRHWRSLDVADAWLSYAPRAARATAAVPGAKLYLSPLPEALPRVFVDFVDALARTDAMQFKVGADLYGLLRPDKLVVYFADREASLAAVDVLRATLAGVTAQGVPFTAEAAGALLSWGVDPGGFSQMDGLSWRQWVTNRLASALVAARAQAAGAVEPWRFALERIRLEGVDPQTFAPTAAWTGTARP